MATYEDARAEMIRSRGFIRGAETQLTKAITALDEAMAAEPPVDPPTEPPVEPELPTASFTVEDVDGLDVVLDASASTGDGLTYSWDLGKSPDGTATGKVVTTTYPHAGERTVVLTVTDSLGQTAVSSRVFEVVEDATGPGEPEPPDEPTVPDEPDTPPATGLAVSDNFDSGAFGSPIWGAPNRTDVRDMMADVGVAAFSGSHALRFRYPAVIPNSFAEQRFSLGGSFRELWLRYRLFVPADFNHPRSSPSNNKFLRLHDEAVSDSKRFHVTMEFQSNSDGTSSFRRFLSRCRGLFPSPTSAALDGVAGWPDPNVSSGEIQGGPGDFISKPGGVGWTGKFLRIGQWNLVRVYFRAASAFDAFDGYCSLHINGTLAKQLTWNFWGQDEAGNSKEARVSGGYLMGWANSGYAAETKFWIDDVQFRSADPGW